METEIALAPVAGWQTGTVEAYGVGILTLRYLVSPMESLEQAHASPTFALTRSQLRELGQKLIELSQRLENAGETSDGSPTH